ncbi:MAG: AGE family epimerase/isomerase [Eubacteriales bacterium]
MLTDIRAQYRQKFRQELVRCTDFWLKYGMDGKYGGIYTCLDRTGKIFSADKSVWMQGRCGWMFAWLCNTYGVREEWLAASRSCIDFLDRFCADSDRRMYFTVTEDGRPLRKRRYFFSETFSIMAHAEYAKASGDLSALEKAREYYDFVYSIYCDRSLDPYKITPKTLPQTRSCRSLAEPMILLNVSQIMRRCDPSNAGKYSEIASRLIGDIFGYHYKAESNMLLENVGMNGEFLDNVSTGRLINPGHDMEASWFLLSEAELTGDEELAKKAEAIFNGAFSRGFDKQYGGILYFVDAYGFPPEPYEHDMKLWWVHDEAMIASLMFYRHTGDEKYAEIFRSITEYAFGVFSDPEYGEWYGYLRRDGLPTEPACKGSTYKGPFHLPRMLVTTLSIMDSCGNV